MPTAREIHGIGNISKIQQAVIDYVKTITNVVDKSSLGDMCKDYAAGSGTKASINKLNDALKGYISSYTNSILSYRDVMNNIGYQYSKIDENTESLAAGINSLQNTRKS